MVNSARSSSEYHEVMSGRTFSLEALKHIGSCRRESTKYSIQEKSWLSFDEMVV